MKMKLKVVKKCPSGDKYVFINGVAAIPGMAHRDRSPYTITLKEFAELVAKKEGNAM